MKSWTNRFLIPSLLVVASLVVAINAGLAFRAIDNLRASERWVEHTWKVINQVENIMGSAKDAETGTRGYILTGEDDYLQPYRAATRALPGQLDQFQFLTTDNPRQQRRVAEMRAVLEQRLALLQQSIDLRQANSSDGVRAFILSGTGKAEMDHLRQIADQMEADEQTLLVQRTGEAQHDALRARYTVGIASALDFLLIVFVSRYFARERKLRLETEQAAERLAISRALLQKNAEEISALNATNSKPPTASWKPSATPSRTICARLCAPSTAFRWPSKKTTRRLSTRWAATTSAVSVPASSAWAS
jgi:CHASE3 domain sensor protein